MRAVLLGSVLLVAALAGCIEMEGGGSANKDTEPTGTPYADANGGPLRLYLLSPSSLEVAKGNVQVVATLWDASNEELVRGASVAATLGASAATLSETSAGTYSGPIAADVHGMHNLSITVTAPKVNGQFVIRMTVAAGADMVGSYATFASFDEAFAAGTDMTAGPSVLSGFTASQSDGVGTPVPGTGTTYRHEFQVDSLLATEIMVNLSYSAGTVGALDDLTLSLIDPSGNTESSAVAAQTTLSTSNITLGTWAVEISGTQVGASYEMTVTKTHAAAAKLVQPTAATGDVSPLQIVIYNPTAMAPIVGASAVFSGDASGEGTTDSNGIAQGAVDSRSGSASISSTVTHGGVSLTFQVAI